jgi:thioredoxin reductase
MENEVYDLIVIGGGPAAIGVRVYEESDQEER